MFRQCIVHRSTQRISRVNLTWGDSNPGYPIEPTIPRYTVILITLRSY